MENERDSSISIPTRWDAAALETLWTFAGDAEKSAGAGVVV